MYAFDAGRVAPEAVDGRGVDLAVQARLVALFAVAFQSGARALHWTSLARAKLEVRILSLCKKSHRAPKRVLQRRRRPTPPNQEPSI